MTFGSRVGETVVCNELGFHALGVGLGSLGKKNPNRKWKKDEDSSKIAARNMGFALSKFGLGNMKRIPFKPINSSVCGYSPPSPSFHGEIYD